MMVLSITGNHNQPTISNQQPDLLLLCVSKWLWLPPVNWSFVKRGLLNIHDCIFIIISIVCSTSGDAAVLFVYHWPGGSHTPLTHYCVLVLSNITVNQTIIISNDKKKNCWCCAMWEFDGGKHWCIILVDPLLTYVYDAGHPIYYCQPQSNSNLKSVTRTATVWDFVVYFL